MVYGPVVNGKIGADNPLEVRQESFYFGKLYVYLHFVYFSH